MFSLKQKGMSPISVLFVVCAFALILMVALKLSTHYLDYNSIRKAYQAQSESPGIKDAAPQKILDDIDKQLRINSVRDFDLKGNSYFENEKGAKVLGFKYEVREHMFANVDVVLSFEYEAEIE